MTNDSKVLSFIRSLDEESLTPSKVLIALSLSVIIILFCAHITLVYTDTREFNYYSEDNYSRVERVIFHLSHGLTLAEKTGSSLCSEEDITQLRDILQRYYHIGDLARVSNNQVICSVKKGKLRQPTKIDFHNMHNIGSYYYGNSHVITRSNDRPFIMLGNTLAYVSDIFILEFDLGGVRTQGFGTLVHTTDISGSLGKEPFIFRMFGHILPEDIPRIIKHKNSWADYFPNPKNIRTKSLCNEFLSVCVTTINTRLGLYSLSTLSFSVLICFGVVVGLIAAYIWKMYNFGPIGFRRNLKSAILKGEIVPFYQPQVKLDKIEVCGVESLARWYDRKHKKMIPPDVFIPFAEGENLIELLTKKFVRLALLDMHEKLNSNPDFTLSINITPSVMIKKDFIQFLQKESGKYKCNPKQIVLEITERSADDSQRMTHAVKTLSSLGYTISLDDFGTGFSNFEWLTVLNPNEIKIDKMFTQSIATDSVNAMTLNGMLHMLDHIKIRTVFEGIETEEQLSQLRKRLPDAIGQGWLFAKPVEYSRLDEEINKIKQKG